MNSLPQSLATFFGNVSVDDWAERAAALRSNPAFAQLAGMVAEFGDLMSWPATLGEISRKIPDLLKLDPSKVVLGAWAKSKEFRRYADPEKYPPDETVLVTLARHTIKSAHEPRLEVRANEVLVDTVDFSFSLAIEVEGAVLEIRDGKIWDVALGNCTASGELTCEGHSLAKRESEPFELPGNLMLSEPIPIMYETAAPPSTETPA
jgi:hypothetical protein